MNYNEKPIVLISKCLGFEPCRYNGGIVNDSFIEALKDYVEFITVCPETSMGLTTPRDSLRIVEIGDKISLVQPKTNKDLTENIKKFNSQFLAELGEIDAIILKSKSPCCGIKDARIYPKIEKCSALRRGKGFFAEAAVDKYPLLPIEDEGRLTNFKIREHFLTRIYVLADFRICKKEKSFQSLRDFHIKNSLLFLSYSQKYSKVLDSLIYGDSNDFNEIIDEYEFNLLRLLNRAPRYTSNINVLMRTIEQFNELITEEENQFIWNTIDKYRNGFVTFSVPLHVVKGYLIRFELENLLNQTFFRPYPEELIQVTDSGKMIH